jgi:hypothetical protein
VIAAPWREDVCLRVAAALEAQGVARARILSLPPGRPKEGDVPPGGTARSARERQ